MIEELAKALKAFPGSVNRTRCFTHILNLVAKCIMRQFDGPKKSKRTGEDALDLGWAFEGLEEELEDEDEIDEDNESEGGEEDVEEIEGLEELLSGREGMTAEEIETLEASVKPVRLVLTKVSQGESDDPDDSHTSNLAPKGRTRNQELVNDCLAGVVRHS
jgi:hypothetical protein